VYSETPLGEGFLLVEADLEDVYFRELSRHRPN
jgi:hypothetical protein